MPGITWPFELLKQHDIVVVGGEADLVVILVDAGHGPGRGEADFGELDVEGLAIVVEGGRLQDDSGRTHQHRHGEDPQKQPVQHHGHVLPVLYDLKGMKNYLLNLGWGALFTFQELSATKLILL